MNPVIISTEALRRAPRALSQPGSIGGVASSQTRFTDLPLPARLLLAVPRARGHSTAAPIAERYVLDTLGRIIDAGPERQRIRQSGVVIHRRKSCTLHALQNPYWAG